MVELSAALALLSAGQAAAATATPINMAEAIIEPFWDPQLSGFKHWHVDPGEKYGLTIGQDWSKLRFQWNSRPAAGPALRMTRHFDIDCVGYDRLLVSVMAPRRSIVQIDVTTDRGHRTFSSPPATDDKAEHTVDLAGATRIETITLEVFAQRDGIGLGWFNWIGLQNTKLLPRYLTQWQRFDERWEAYLVDTNYEPRFEPRRGVLIDAAELETLRARH